MRGMRTRTLMRLTGTVSSGLGRAHIFMAQDHYQEQFKLILGDVAWPGTLNVQVSGEDLVSYVALRSYSGVDTLDIDEKIKIKAADIDLSNIESQRIRGFLREGRSFGGATAFDGTIRRHHRGRRKGSIALCDSDSRLNPPRRCRGSHCNRFLERYTQRL